MLGEMFVAMPANDCEIGVIQENRYAVGSVSFAVGVKECVCAVPLGSPVCFIISGTMRFLEAVNVNVG